MYPASQQQTELWLEGFSSAGFASHNLLWAVDIAGHANHQNLKTALFQVLAAYPVLRSRFAYHNRRLWVTETQLSQIDLPETDMTGLPRQIIDQQIAAFGMRTFDPATGPLVRFLHMRLSAQRSVLLCGFHHLVIDGQSWPMVLGALAQALNGTALAKPTFCYASYCQDQDQSHQNGLSASDLAYWQAIAAGKKRRTTVPWEILPSGGAAQNASVRIHLGQSKSDKVTACATRLGTTPFRMCFAVFAAWLARVTQHPNQRITTALTGRTGTGPDDLIGFCNTTGIIDTVAQADTPFAALATELAQSLGTAVQHHRLPAGFALKGAGAAQLARTLGQDGTAFVKLPRQQQLETDGLVLSDRRIFLPTSQTEFSVTWQQELDGIALTWNFPADRLLKTSAAAFAQQYEHMLDQVLGDPSLCIGALSLLPHNQKSEILRQACGPQRDAPIDDPLSRQITQQAQNWPTRIAVVDGATRLTYADLDAASDCLAQNLHQSGAQRGTLVPLIMASSAALVVAELAVMKTGAAFVPIDPNWPTERRRSILTRLGAPVAVLQDGSDTTIAGHDGPAIRLDHAGRAINKHPTQGTHTEDLHPVAADDTLYAIFTSGSTGTPKGALNTHRGVANRLFAMSDMFGAETPPTVLAGAPSTVDTHVWQYLWPLMMGGRTVILPREQALSAGAISAICAQERITFLDFIPSVFKKFTDHLHKTPDAQTALASVQWIIIGGDRMQSDTVRMLKSHCPAIRIMNSYGPTEAAIASIFQEVDADTADGAIIGRPIANTSAAILDKNLNLLPHGIPGEICLGGVAVGAGYLDLPEDTAARFVPSPYPALGARLYRTGDLGRLHRDGSLEFLGRADDQISLAGNRIEPGDVETSLLAHPSVSAAAVALRANGPNGPVLVAHIVPQDAAPLTARALREWLLQRLPRQMVPTEYRQTNALPLTRTGKLDRATLSKTPYGQLLSTQVDATQPETGPVRAIIRIWETVLRRDGIRPDDDFFLDLGGDSLLALECELLCEERTGREPDLHRFFTHSTPADLARATQRADTDAPDTIPQSIQHILRRQKAFLTGWDGQRSSNDALLFTQNAGGMGRPLFWCLQGFQELKALSHALGPDHPVTGMRSGHMIMDYTPQTVTALAERYASEIAKMSVPKGLILGGNCQGAEIMHEVAMILLRGGHAVDMLITLDDTTFKPYPGRATLIFGRDSHLNPFNAGQQPNAFLQQTYPAGVSTAFVSGRHGTYFRQPGLTDLAHIVKGILTNPTPAPAMPIDTNSTTTLGIANAAGPSSGCETA